MILDILLPVGRLIAATLVGFLVFKIDLVRRYALRPFVFLIVNIVFPLYFVHTMPSQWADGLAAGWGWMVVFFFAYLVFLAVQYGLARVLINRVRLFRTEHPQELLVLFAMHNAGYIPIPIIAALTPPAVSVYISFYMMAFVLSFFTVAVWIIQGAARIRTTGSSQADVARAAPSRPRFKLNAPLVGIFAGLLFAVTGFYDVLPGWAKAPFRFSSVIALDAIMGVLGAVLASIPGRAIRIRREFIGLVLVKMLLYPAVVLGVMALIPLGGLDPQVASGIKLAMVLQAVVPPATNILVITKAYGTDEQVEYAGSAIAVTYAASIVLIPLFLIASRLAF
ncbi:MAG: AEC family transporter [Spirochaetota bacterium]